MKDRDISRAIGELPDDLRAEFDEWQKSRAPLTEPVIKRTHGKDIHLRVWSAGIGTAVAASLVIGVSVGRDALHHANEAVSSPAAEIAEQSAAEIAEQHTPAEMLAETSVREPVPLEVLAQFGGKKVSASKVPAEGAVQVLRSMDDLQPLIDATDGYGPDGDDEAFFDSQGLNAETFGEYDVLYFAYPAWGYMPDGLYQREICGAEYCLDGSLNVLFSDLLLEDPPEGFRRDSHVDQDWNIYYYCKVPKDSLPDIETVRFVFPAHYVGGLPDDVRENWSAAGDPDAAPSERRTKLQLYLESTQEYLDWVMTCPKKLWVTWEPENGIPLVGCGWFTGSHSTEIAVPPEGMTEVIRSMEDAQPFIDALSHGNAQFTMSDYLNAEWLQNHDILFCGIDPDAYGQFGLSAGRICADGVLDLQFSALNQNEQSDGSILPGADDRFYWYCSVPKNTLPQITDVQITVQQYADYAEYSGTVCGQKYLLRTAAQSSEIRTADAAFPSEPFSARNVLIEGILEMRTDGTIETPTAAVVRSEAEYAEMQAQYNALQEDIYDPERNNLLLILPMQAGEGDFTINSVEIRGGEVYATITLETPDAKHTEPEYRMNTAAVCRLTVSDPLPDIRPAMHLTVQYDSELAITELMKAMPYTDYIAVSE